MNTEDKFYKEYVKELPSDLPEELKIQILDRAKQAVDKQLFAKLVSVKHSSHPNFKIEYEHTPDEWGSDGTVPGYEKVDAFWKEDNQTHANATHVFSELGWGIPSRYIPGPWEAVLENLYLQWKEYDTRAREQKKLEKEALQHGLEREAAAKYGINWR